MRVLVIGANGFLGRAIIAEFLKARHEVFCLVSPKSKISNELPNVFRGDITNFENLKKLSAEIGKIDVVVNSAGLAHQFRKISDEKFIKINVNGTENSARLAGKLDAGHFIQISSVAVYGNVNKKSSIDENDNCNPQGIYAISKVEGEKRATEICETKKIALTILRPVTIIGEGDRGNTARLIEAIDKRRFFWIGKGENHKSLIYKQDVAKACLKILAKTTSETEIFNVSAEAVTMKFIVSQIAGNLKRKLPPFSVSVKLLETIFRTNAVTAKLEKIAKLGETVEKWISEDVFSSEKIFKTYGFQPQTSISEGLRRQIEFYKLGRK